MERAGQGGEGGGREEKPGLGEGTCTGRMTSGAERGKVCEHPILGQGLAHTWVLALSLGSFTF